MKVVWWTVERRDGSFSLKASFRTCGSDNSSLCGSVRWRSCQVDVAAGNGTSARHELTVSSYAVWSDGRRFIGKSRRWTLKGEIELLLSRSTLLQSVWLRTNDLSVLNLIVIAWRRRLSVSLKQWNAGIDIVNVIIVVSHIFHFDRSVEEKRLKFQLNDQI